MEEAAARLRSISLDSCDGALLGSEGVIVAELGVSRGTVRQVARMLEQEGLLRVRRGNNGGYFSARPGLHVIETTVAAYLDTLKMDARNVGRVASVLWVEVVRQAAALGTDVARGVAARLQTTVQDVLPGATFRELMAVEQQTRTAIFDLVDGRYIELIFQINGAFARRRFPQFDEEGLIHLRSFVAKWKSSKLMELTAIADGDPELGAMAARHCRNLWDQRVDEARRAAGDLPRTGDQPRTGATARG